MSGTETAASPFYLQPILPRLAANEPQISGMEIASSPPYLAQLKARLEILGAQTRIALSLAPAWQLQIKLEI